jgi:hypothetical protein
VERDDDVEKDKKFLVTGDKKGTIDVKSGGELGDE